MPKDLIVFGEDWGALPSSTQHLVSHLALDRKVVWINSIGLRRPRLSWRDLHRVWAKLCSSQGDQSTNNLSYPSQQFSVISPLTLPAPRTTWARKLSSRLLVSKIRPVLQQLKIKAPILWTSLPTAVDVAGELGESALVYYCGDDFSELAGVDHHTVRQRERQLILRSDLVLAASNTLAEKLPSDKVRLLPHGVDIKHFSSPAPRAHDLPTDGRPIAGFYGSISEWLGLELMTSTISRMPDWHFVFIGKSVIDLTPLKQFHNVHLLGPRAHQDLPAYSQHWNVSLLPFRDNGQIRACNPLKLREYLASGRPIVSTEFPALDGYRHLIDCVANTNQMIDAIRQYASPSFRPEFVEAVSNDDWTSRAEQLSDWLEAL
jgi:glycosyltransferase involved in cell wall biosynthesis